jgi:hypothetical protein
MGDEMENDNVAPPMPETVAIALAIAGLYGECLRAQERGDTKQAVILEEAFHLLNGKLSLERGDYVITQQLCDTMLKAHEERIASR